MNRSIPFALAIVVIVAACDANNSTGPFVGTVKGSISDTLGDPLRNGQGGEGVGTQGKVTTVLLDAAGRDDGDPAVGEQRGCDGLGQALQ